jgi:segregation and condensation protein B
MSPRKKRDKKPTSNLEVVSSAEDASTEQVDATDEVSAADDRASTEAELAADAADAERGSDADSIDSASNELGSEDEAQPDEDEALETPKTREHLKRVIESLIFVADQAVSAQHLAKLVKGKSNEVRELVSELMTEYQGRGIEIVELSGGYQFRSAPITAPFVRDLVAHKPVRLTRAQLETLALVAYRQPITRPEIDDVRGVDSGSALKVLLERNLLKILGRKDEAGRPLLYGTAPHFLEFFGMKSMGDLPTLREFTDLTEENRELFRRKTGEIPDLSNEPVASMAPSEGTTSEDIDDAELFAIAQAARAEEAGEGASIAPDADSTESASDSATETSDAHQSGAAESTPPHSNDEPAPDADEHPMHARDALDGESH